MDDGADYDEFSMLKQYADHEGIAWTGQPEVERVSVDVGGGQRVSALSWGSGAPELVLLHGGGQNAHTWDSVAMALGRPLLAVDLPGHGHSDWRDDHDYGPLRNAQALAPVLEQRAGSARAVVGMSLGGMTTIRLAAQQPYLVRRAVIVDITPGSGGRRAGVTREQRGATVLLESPAEFASFDEMLAAAAAAVPGRPVDSLRPGVLHNSRRREDGKWVWRYDRERAGAPLDRDALWRDVSAITAPVMLVRGSRSAMVHDDDVAELLRRQPRARVEVVDDAGHSVQSDRPLHLARLITEFLDSSP